MNREQFDESIANEKMILKEEQEAAGSLLQQRFGLLPMENPFEYVKSVQKGFNDSRIQYSDEYYDVTGIENPKGCLSPD